MKLVEQFCDILLFWIPFYTTLKLALLIWLAYPDLKGASKVYDSLVRPILLRHEK
jgi:hypothetical protein